MKKILGIVVLGLLWCNILSAKIVNIENKISLDIPANHKYTELKDDDVFFGDMYSTFEDLEIFDPKVFISGPNNLIDFIEAVRNGEDPMKNRYIASFMKKSRKKIRNNGRFQLW